ncbi:MAG TPA: hypothetical protein VNX02_11565 [Steroidobacteraceae bacterium]|nr:hypothetical protein [Steroidobacteraceae bacterium]
MLPADDHHVSFAGRFDFRASWTNGLEVSDAYELRIEVPDYPEHLPNVFETGGRIPRDANHHVFPRSGKLCLGSELRLRQVIGPKLSVLRFADLCIVPYLYAASRQQTTGGFVLGELAHGNPGILQDYQDIFGVSTPAATRAALRALATKPTSAARHPCPCGCGRRLAQCGFRERIEQLRKLAPRKSFEAMSKALDSDSRGEKA